MAFSLRNIHVLCGRTHDKTTVVVSFQKAATVSTESDSNSLLYLEVSWTHSAAVLAVLHVDVVAEVVPHALDAQEVVIDGAVADPGQRVDEEVLLDAPTS